MANFSRIDARFQELKECSRCHCEIQQDADRCVRCGLVLDPVSIWMIENNERRSC